MKALSLPFACLAALSTLPALHAVYAPIPLQEQGKALTFSLEVGEYYDSNIFGANTGRIESFVTQVTPRVDANYSLSDQSFLSAYYELQYMYFDSRPGDKNLFNNRLGLDFDHTFSEALFLSVSDDFGVIDNPQSAIVTGTPIQTDQSYISNFLQGELTWQATPVIAIINKYRNSYWDYDDSTLATQLDRMEHLYGLELDYDYLPDWTLVGEYRLKYNDYRNNALPKDSLSNFLLAGFDYQSSEQLSLLARAGVDFRDRDATSNETAPYGELTAVYQYAPRSFVSGAFTYGIFETTDTTQFLDSEDAIFIINTESYVTDFIVLSGAVTFQYSTLQQRPGNGIGDAIEKTWRLGAGVSYLPTPNWAVILTYDYDFVNSQVVTRNQVRNRVGISGRYTF